MGIILPDKNAFDFTERPESKKPDNGREKK